MIHCSYILPGVFFLQKHAGSWIRRFKLERTSTGGIAMDVGIGTGGTGIGTAQNTNFFCLFSLSNLLRKENW